MNKNLRYFLVTLGVVVAVSVLWYFKSIVAYILISAVLSLIGRPIINFLNKLQYKKFRIPNAISALLTLVLFWAIVLVFFRVFIPLVASQARELSNIDTEAVIQNLKDPIEKLESIFEKYNISSDNHSMEQYLTRKFIALVNVSALSEVFSSIAEMLGNIFIAIFSISFITFFFLKDKGLLYDGILLIVPDKYLENAQHILTSIKKLLTRYFTGIVVQISGIITLVSVSLTFIVGIDFSDALIIGLVVGVMNIIPYLGPIIGAFLGIVLGLAINLDLSFYTELLPLLGYMAIVFIVVQVIDNILFQPLIYSSSVNAHPLEIFLVILIAGSLFSITGMILAIPAYTIFRVVAKEFFINLKLVKKLTEKI